MAFETTNVPPSPTSKVTLTFSGLVVLKPGAVERTCEIGVHKSAANHQFQVLLILSQPGRPPVVGSVFTGKFQKGFKISRQAVAPAPDFRVYEEDKFDRTVPVPATTPPPFDHRWAINIALKHPGVNINDDAKPVITLNTGVLYTPNLTDPIFKPKFTRGTEEDRLNQIAANFAVSIEPEGSIVFEEEDPDPHPDKALRVELPRRGDPDDMTYTLAIVNEPPSFATPGHEEFKFYYEILQKGGRKIPPGEQYELVFDLEHVRLDEVPCMPTEINP